MSRQEFCLSRGQIYFATELPHTLVEQSRARPDMAAFYARYVPPSKPAQKLDTYDRGSSKRKPDDDLQTSEASQKRAKTKTSKKAESIAQKQSQTSSKDTSKGCIDNRPSNKDKDSGRLKVSLSAKPGSGGKEVLAKYSSVKTAEKSNDIHISRRANGGDKFEPSNLDSPRPESPPGQTEKKKHRKKGDQGGRSFETGDEKHFVTLENGTQVKDGGMDQRHAAIRRKFEKSKDKVRINALNADANDGKKQEQGQSGETDNQGAAAVELHGLEPLPQPQQAEPSTEVPTYSTLPSWMASPVRVPSTSSAYFKDLNLDAQLISNLQHKGICSAFAVQIAVLPLLTRGKSRHRGDICISAATGSGKTLAYVVPMIQALKDFAGTKLRGLIVVPTRELVAQAREVCEVCSAGMNIRVATALGSKALKDEQNALVESHLVYDPEQYINGREQPVDWTSLGLEDILSQSDEAAPPAYYVKKFTSKVDVLITTPGRLVDHLRSTPGFTLDDVQWVVIDEADRLLNESFQEWIEVVMPAVNSDAATRSKDQLLREMGLEVSERQVQKVILSATMTQDISKLNSLGLRNPKLVIVGDLPNPQVVNQEGHAVEDTNPVVDANGVFHLPATLSEYALPVGDGSQKPLYLLELLNSHILRAPDQLSKPRAGTDGNASTKTSLAISNGTTEDSYESDEATGSSFSATSDISSSSDSSASDSSVSATSPHSTSPAQTALIFTRSTEAATRLSRLLSLLSPSLAPSLGTLTKSTNTSSSRKTLSQFRQGKLMLLVATDRASRGLDLPGLRNVISYDVPISVTTYIHRVGRTARAGKEGKAWTLVGHREARWFWNEIGKAKEPGVSGEVRVGRGERKVKRVNLEIGDDDGLGKKYEDALRVLREEVRGNA